MGLMSMLKWLIPLRLFYTVPHLIVLRESLLQNVPSGLIRAIISAESSWNAKAFRPEPQIGDASYGLMQILLGTARQLGYKGTAEKLFEPSINIRLGARYLKSRMLLYSTYEEAIAAYNAGQPRRAADGRFINQAYVDKVMSLWR